MYRIEEQPAGPAAHRPAEDPVAKRETEVPTYYGVSSLKKSPYHRRTALSFLAEATGGGPQVLAALIHFAGNPEDRSLVRAGRYLGLAGAFLGPALLVSELHTPRRWLNMLRIFRPTSAMSIGNLSLISFGVFSGLTAMGQLLEDRGHAGQESLLARSCALPAALAGAMVCLYPGTELEQTSVPLWAGSHPLLAPLFAATGLSAGAAALTLAAQGETVPEQSRDRLNALAIMVLAVQLTGALLVERSWRTHGSSSLRSSSRGGLYRLGVLGCTSVIPLVLRLLPGPDSRRRKENRAMASAATLAGSYFLYETVLEGGNTSAASATEYLRETQAGRKRPAGSSLPGVLGLAVLTAAGAAYFLWKRRSS